MSRLEYFNLAIPAPKRLAMMRQDFAGHATQYPHCPEHAKPLNWRNVRGSTLGGFCAYFGTLSGGRESSGSQIWYTHQGEYFRRERDAGEIVSRRPRGWYTDTHQDETAIGIVASLPHGRFIAGYRWTSNGERVYFPEIFDDEEEAARRADSHAESFADSSREDSERFDAMQEAEIETEHIRALLAKRLPGRNATEALREEVRELIAELRAARETQRAATQAYERG